MYFLASSQRKDKNAIVFKCFCTIVLSLWLKRHIKLLLSSPLPIVWNFYILQCNLIIQPVFCTIWSAWTFCRVSFFVICTLLRVLALIVVPHKLVYAVPLLNHLFSYLVLPLLIQECLYSDALHDRHNFFYTWHSTNKF